MISWTLTAPIILCAAVAGVAIGAWAARRAAADLATPPEEVRLSWVCIGGDAGDGQINGNRRQK